MKPRMLMLLPGLLLFAADTAADGVAVDPGLWEMTMTMEMSMMPAPQTRTTTECVEQDSLSPDDFNIDEETSCEISDVEIEGDTASWGIMCPGPLGPMTGRWSFTSHGDTIAGSGSMSTDVGGQTMDFSMNWSGKRVGDCEVNG